MSNAFSVTEPDWNSIKAADITASPYLKDDHHLAVPTHYFLSANSAYVFSKVEKMPR